MTSGRSNLSVDTRIRSASSLPRLVNLGGGIEAAKGVRLRHKSLFFGYQSEIST